MTVHFFRLSNPLRAKKIGPASKCLPEFHESRAQLLHGQAYLDGWLKAGQICRMLMMQRVSGTLQRVRF